MIKQWRVEWTPNMLPGILNFPVLILKAPGTCELRKGCSQRHQTPWIVFEEVIWTIPLVVREAEVQGENKMVLGNWPKLHHLSENYSAQLSQPRALSAS